MAGNHYIYIIAPRRGDGYYAKPVKVGIARDPHRRLREIQTGHPSELQVAVTFAMPSQSIARKIEHAFHTVQADKRTRGEWFDISVTEAVWLMCLNIRAGLERLEPATASKALATTGVLDLEANLRRNYPHMFAGPTLQ